MAQVRGDGADGGAPSAVPFRVPAAMWAQAGGMSRDVCCRIGCAAEWRAVAPGSESVPCQDRVFRVSLQSNMLDVDTGTTLEGSIQVSEGEREVLLAAQKKAMDVLSASSAEAKRVVSEAEVEAVALILEQQGRAESLLHREQEAASERARSRGGASALLESHRTAAELLAATDQEVAVKLRGTKTNAAVDVLMAGQREAAAILLEAWMRVTEGRPPAGSR